MKRKTLIGGLTTLITFTFVALLCFWVGKKIYDRAVETVSTNGPTAVSRTKLPAKPSDPAEAKKIYLAPGNPSGADTRDRDNFLVVNTAFALSYNNTKGTPNWVAWRITQGDLGEVERQNDFRPDPNLPSGFKHITPSDYSGSGFDRGHLCPSGDRSSDPETNSETFLMSNIAPQTGDLNRFAWEKLEAYGRTLVRRGHVDLFVIAGVYGENGRVNRKITIPTNFWKIIVAVPEGEGIDSVNEQSHIIAVDMPNAIGISQDNWRKYRTSVRAIEQRTGYDFFSALPQQLQDALETRVDD